MSKEWKTFGTVYKNSARDGKAPKHKTRIYIKQDVVLKKGDTVQVQDVKENLKRRLDTGSLSAEKFEEYLAKAEESGALFDLVLPPKND